MPTFRELIMDVTFAIMGFGTISALLMFVYLLMKCMIRGKE